MALVFDATNKRIVLDVADISAAEIFSRWEDWAATGDNSKYLPAFRHLGGDELGGGLYVANYFFLINGWRVRPMESNHVLVITGNLIVDGGGAPVVQTLGAYNVSVQYTVPVQAQGIATGGGGSGMTPTQAQQLADLWRKEGLDPATPVTVDKALRKIFVGDPLSPFFVIDLSGDFRVITTMERQ